MTDVRAKFLPDGAVVAAGGGRTLLELAEESGTPLRSVCGGIGNCTSCRVRIVAGELPPGRTDHARLGPLVAHGWRLACQHVPAGHLTVERPPPTDL
ncbi:MAG TPA: 2Fe-2S iron-sulfur cluster binding domain-containing protein [Gemmatimonadales bacterium]|nr:2Fe-2S iron-sulfur cluster binding domain-containing protein [Gemmatimonadales bacterium]